MASYQHDRKKGTARIHFRYGGQQLNRVEKVDDERHAQRIVALVEDTLIDIGRGKLLVPPDVDIRTFILTGGKVQKRPQAVAESLHDTPTPSPTVGSVFDAYATMLTPGAKEANSIETEAVHSRHFKRVLGADHLFDTLAVDTLQRYVDRRSGQGIVRDTVRKELATLRVVWGWAAKRKLVASPPSWKMADLTFPKAHEKPPFLTWDQITRRIAKGGLTSEQEAELWESLWLDQAQTVECLEWVRERAAHPFVHPMFAFAAYTGARRSEMLRSERDDWDFDSGIVVIRQKKADKSKSFTRRSVPIHLDLADVMKAWFESHPGGHWTIATDDGSPIGPRMSTKYFRGVVAGGKWNVIHGWHTFRHSLASNMASAGVDQRLINAILGHHTEEMERRYRHLLPQKQEHALNALFRSEVST